MYKKKKYMYIIVELKKVFEKLKNATRRKCTRCYLFDSQKKKRNLSNIYKKTNAKSQKRSSDNQSYTRVVVHDYVDRRKWFTTRDSEERKSKK